MVPPATTDFMLASVFILIILQTVHFCYRQSPERRKWRSEHTVHACVHTGVQVCVLPFVCAVQLASESANAKQQAQN